MSTYITMGAFIYRLYQRMAMDMPLEEILQQGLHAGWVDAEDIYLAEDPMERRRAARIIHQFLRLVLQEQDTEDWTLAKQLQDLYDCRTCVNHVAQVYAKGIMKARETSAGELIFGMREPVTVEETDSILERVWSPRLRYGYEEIETQREKQQPERSAKSISLQQAKELLQEYKKRQQNYLLLDVRSMHNHEGDALFEARQISFTRILEEADCVGRDKGKPILIYCEQGYRSEIAAHRLIDIGYEKVFYFAWNGEKCDE